MASLRCSQCGTNWPVDHAEYRTCPGCESATSYMGSAVPLDVKDAKSLSAHQRFERFYENEWPQRFTRDLAEISELPEAA